jgi:signal transduction histidine kinase
MFTSNPHAPQEQRRFRLVKFFAWASFIVLIIFSFPFSVVISQKAKDILMKSYENYALLLGENLSHQVYQNFAVPAMRRFGQIRLREKPQFEWLDRIVRSTIYSFNIDLVNIYDIQKGVIAYSTDTRLLGKEVRESFGYKRAVEGETSSGIISEGDDLWGLGIERLGGEKKLRTYIPFRGFDPFTGERSHLMGVFEIIQDLSVAYQEIVKFQYLIFGLSIVIMGLIFLALLFIVHRAERFIEEQAQEQRQLEAQLNQAERLAALGQMVAGISHEIRNPLGIIRSTAELLGDMPENKEAQKRLSKVIVEESSRLNSIVTEFLDFARPVAPRYEDCFLDEILGRNLSFVKPELERKGILVRTNFDGRALRISADPDMLYRAFLNILLNAIQAMENGGEIRVNVWEEGKNYTLGFEDTGCGIQPHELEKIFEPFFTRKEKGTGLGLSIVKKLIESHNGTIRVESQEKIGTRVIIQLPRAV